MSYVHLLRGCTRICKGLLLDDLILIRISASCKHQKPDPTQSLSKILESFSLRQQFTSHMHKHATLSASSAEKGLAEVVSGFKSGSAGVGSGGGSLGWESMGSEVSSTTFSVTFSVLAWRASGSVVPEGRLSGCASDASAGSGTWLVKLVFLGESDPIKPII